MSRLIDLLRLPPPGIALGVGMLWAMISWNAWAQRGDSYFKDGNNLFDLCKSGGIGETACIDYVIGAIDGFDFIESIDGPGIRLHFCLPTSVKSGQIKDIVLKYLINYPEQRHQDAAFIVWKSLFAAFPCPKQ